MASWPYPRLATQILTLHIAIRNILSIEPVSSHWPLSRLLEPDKSQASAAPCNSATRLNCGPRSGRASPLSPLADPALIADSANELAGGRRYGGVLLPSIKASSLGNSCGLLFCWPPSLKSLLVLYPVSLGSFEGKPSAFPAFNKPYLSETRAIRLPLPSSRLFP